mmetsp:Transcript_570/g.2029  ORF Transcript_570/g.2029 Transcript_570/m.2029 type:complete len:398 (-) Transcript_570:535-1728(-)
MRVGGGAVRHEVAVDKHVARSHPQWLVLDRRRVEHRVTGLLLRVARRLLALEASAIRRAGVLGGHDGHGERLLRVRVLQLLHDGAVLALEHLLASALVLRRQADASPPELVQPGRDLGAAVGLVRGVHGHHADAHVLLPQHAACHGLAVLGAPQLEVGVLVGEVAPAAAGVLVVDLVFEDGGVGLPLPQLLADALEAVAREQPRPDALGRAVAHVLRAGAHGARRRNVRVHVGGGADDLHREERVRVRLGVLGEGRQGVRLVGGEPLRALEHDVAVLLQLPPHLRGHNLLGVELRPWLEERAVQARGQRVAERGHARNELLGGGVVVRLLRGLVPPAHVALQLEVRVGLEGLRLLRRHAAALVLEREGGRRAQLRLVVRLLHCGAMGQQACARASRT